MVNSKMNSKNGNRKVRRRARSRYFSPERVNSVRGDNRSAYHRHQRPGLPNSYRDQGHRTLTKNGRSHGSEPDQREVHLRSRSKKRPSSRGTRIRTRSIDINVFTECPPSEPRQNQAARVANAPCHTNWDIGYHPATNRNSSFAEEEESSDSISSFGDKTHSQYRPIQNFLESSSRESFSKFPERFIADREVEPSPLQLSYVNVRMSQLPPDESNNLDRTATQSFRITDENEYERSTSTTNNIASRETPQQKNPPPSPAKPPAIPPRPSRPYQVKPAVVSPVAQPHLPEREARAEIVRIPNEIAKDEFPFHETASGNLRITRQQVTLQSPNVAVIVADPERVNLRNIREKHVPAPVAPTIRTTSMSTDPLPTSLSISPLLFLPADDPEEEYEPIFDKLHRSLPPPSTLDRGYETEPAIPTSSIQYGGRGSKGTKAFLENLHYRVKKAINPDTRVVIGNKEFPIHGIALQCYSKYADKQRRSRNQIMELHIPEKVMRSSDFPSIMDWILMDNEEKRGVINSSNVVSLFSGATFLGISQLQDDCYNFLQHRVEDGDPAILSMYEEAKERECRDLVSLLASKLAALFPKIYKTKQFLHMTPKELILLLSADNIVIRSELDVYDAAARWLLFDWDRRKGNTVDIMKTVRFGLLSPLQLTQIRHSSEAASLPNYQEIFAIPQVKKLVESGQTFAILKESYQGHPGELQRWLKATGVDPPRNRTIIRSIPDPQLPSYQYHDEEETTRKATRHKRLSTSTNDQWATGTSSSQKNNTVTRHHLPEHESKYPIISDNVEVDHETIEAATLIQSSIRGWLARKRFQKMKKAAIAVQAVFRASQKKIPIKLRGLRARDGESILVIGGYDNNREIDATNPSTSIFQLDTERNLWNIRGDLPQPRARHGCVQIEGLLYIFGGEDRSRMTEDGKNVKCATTWALDLITGAWKVLSDMTTPRSYFGYSLLHGKIYVFGGLDYNAKALRTCEVYDPKDDTWTRIRSMDGPRLSPAVTKSGDKIWIVGGFTKGQGNPMLKSTIIYDATTDQFYAGPELPFTRCNGSLVSYYNELILLGGATYVGDSQIQSISDVSHLVDGQWITVGYLRTGPRHGHCTLKVGKYVLLVGGVDSGTMTALDQVESFNLEKFRGSTKVANLPLKLSGPSGAVVR